MRRPRSLLFETLVRTYPAEEVTSIAEHEVEPHAAGLTLAGIDAIWAAVERLYATGTHPAIALCLRKRGHIVLDRAIGHLRGNAPRDPEHARRVLARPESLYNIFSASKSVTAMLIHLLDDRGHLHVGDRVTEYLPEFGVHGKDKTTIRHVLTHRAGIPVLPGGFDPSLLMDPDEIVRRLCDSRPSFVPGRRLAYHALTGGYILGAIIERVTGKSLRDYLHDEILAPLGIENMNYGVAPERVPEVAVNAFTGPPVLPPVSIIARRALGVPWKQAVEFSNDPRFLTTVVPSGNIIGTAEEVSRFYQLLLQGGSWKGHKVFQPRTIHRAVQEDSFFEADFTVALPVRYSLGFMLGARRFSLYGNDTTNAFGHIGFANVIAWADPQREVSACLMTTGKPLLTPRLRWLIALVRTISEVLE